MLSVNNFQNIASIKYPGLISNKTVGVNYL